MEKGGGERKNSTHIPASGFYSTLDEIWEFTFYEKWKNTAN